MPRVILPFLLVTLALTAAVRAQAPKTANGTNGTAGTNGKRLFEAKACYQCHGWQGQGGLAGAQLAQTKLTLEAFRAILRKPPPSQMPPYRAPVLTDAEVADLFTYIQSFPAPKAAVDIPLLK